MSNLRQRITTEVLPLVRTPGQYVGGEVNQVRKDHKSVALKFALAFPDTYAIGMSHLGLQILYHMLNSRPDVVCERVFAPWPDMAAELRWQSIPLVTLESATPLAHFDVLGFTLQHEMTYSNILLMLDLARIPLLARNRNRRHPLLIAGGPGALTPEPLADFFDLFYVGEAEQHLPQLIDTLIELKDLPDRTELLHRLATSCQSVYVPSLYEVEYDGPRQVSFRGRFDDVPETVDYAFVEDFENAPCPAAPLVPLTETVHDRIALEIMRGCPHSCRFCQAGMTRKPVRTRSVEKLLKLAEHTYHNTGHDEISLLSLSSNDYPHIEELLRKLHRKFTPLKVNISVPSLHVSPNLTGLPEVLSAVRKSGLTFAPEAATPELRRIIGKNVSDQDLFSGIRAAYEAGWKLLKLYFMVGLPGETDEDRNTIAELALRASQIRQQVSTGAGNVNVSVAWLVPKPHTPFQWEPMADRAVLGRTRMDLAQRLRRTRVRVRFHNIARSCLEAAISRGDRRMGTVIRTAYDLGAVFDDWDEHFQEDIWLEAFSRAHLDPLDFSHRRRDHDEMLPWQHIHTFRSTDYLLQQHDHARRLISERS